MKKLKNSILILTVIFILVITGSSSVPNRFLLLTSRADTHDLAWAIEEFDKSYFEPGIIYPISHVVIGYIKSIGECEFVLHGFYGAELENDTDRYISSYNMINSIEIRAITGSFFQLIDGFSTQLNVNSDNYGFEFGDWNNDGFIDIKLQVCEGGTMRNQPSLFWLWDNTQFVENKQLNEISDYSTVYLETEKDKRLRSFTRGGPGEYSTSFYEYKDEDFIIVENECVYLEEKDDTFFQVTEISKLINGQMKTVSRSREIVKDE